MSIVWMVLTSTPGRSLSSCPQDYGAPSVPTNWVADDAFGKKHFHCLIRIGPLSGFFMDKYVVFGEHKD
ncbi:hypothetical protein JOD43_003887 [Pullulanibacillus pueri]|nr:hypothetical protein [Pullulanibacillus pueri]